MVKGKENQCCNVHQIVEEFYNKILSYIIKNVKNVDVSKDIAQEVMGRLINAYDKNVKINNVQAWLFQVTRNLIADRYRKPDILSNRADSIESVMQPLEEPKLSAEDFIIPMIRLLPEEYSTPLYLSDIENMKQAEVAKKMGINLSAAKMRIQRARKMLHELFLECCDIQYAEDGSFAHCTLKESCDILRKEEDRLRKNMD